MSDMEDRLDDVRDLFISYGYHGTTMRMLTKAMESTESELYHQFGSKRELLIKIIQNEEYVWKSYIEEAEAQTSSTSDSFINTFINIVGNKQRQSLSPRGSLLGNLAGEIGFKDREIHGLIAEQYSNIGRMITRTLNKGKAESEQQSRSVALYILAVIEGSLLLAKADNDFWEMQNGLSWLKEHVK